ncbi:hypothetical protein BDV24DRAFT_71346 [Aspergillus arachidicola]|uniref:Uncharacterized protein n=1 Tax=Aspergillus arachidicola TaxID=656916 RepID=A0A5N6Y310_9EURO|nr:hypothetical protein BDV24DRAFT_71346 [Aspergillus arachidicola]
MAIRHAKWPISRSEMGSYLSAVWPFSATHFCFLSILGTGMWSLLHPCDDSCRTHDPSCGLVVHRLRLSIGWQTLGWGSGGLLTYSLLIGLGPLIKLSWLSGFCFPFLLLAGEWRREGFWWFCWD